MDKMLNSYRNFRKLHEHFKIRNNKIKDFKQSLKDNLTGLTLCSVKVNVNCAVRLNKQAGPIVNIESLLVSINTENERTIHC